MLALFPIIACYSYILLFLLFRMSVTKSVDDDVGVTQSDSFLVSYEFLSARNLGAMNQSGNSVVENFCIQPSASVMTPNEHFLETGNGIGKKPLQIASWSMIMLLWYFRVSEWPTMRCHELRRPRKTRVGNTNCNIKTEQRLDRSTTYAGLYLNFPLYYVPRQMKLLPFLACTLSPVLTQFPFFYNLFLNCKSKSNNFKEC